MHHSRGRGRDSQLGGGDQPMSRGLSQAWSELGKARKELRRMEHRLGETHAAAESGGALGSGGVVGSIPGVAVSGSLPDQTYLVNSRTAPTARFVDSARSPSPTRVPHQGSTARRKVSRLGDKDPSAHGGPASSGRHRHRRERSARSSSTADAYPPPPPPSHHHHHHHHHHAWPDAPVAGGGGSSSSGAPLASPFATSPKRVDFSQRLRLREVKWDGTYRDSVTQNAYPPPAAASLNYPYPSSTSLASAASASLASSSSSAAVGLLDPQSTLTDSRAIRETEIRFLNDSYVTEPLRQQDRLEAQQQQQRHRGPRLTRVDVDLPGSGSRSRDGPGGHAGEWERRGREARHRDGYGVPFPADRGRDMSAPDRGATRDMGDASGGGSGPPGAGAVGGAEGSPRGVSARMQKIKKSLKDLPQDDKILSQLREKIRQQRLSASSTDTSQNDSMASSLPNSETSRDMTPLHTLHDAQEPVRHGDGRAMVPQKMPRTRKVAAGPPIPTYKGFSEAHLDPHLQAAVKQVNRLTAPKRKSHSSQRSPPDPVHSAVQAQLKAHLSAAASSVLPSSTSTPNSKTVEKPRKAPRVVAQGRKPSKPGANNLITTSSWRAGQELVARELGLGKPKSKEEPRRGGSSSSNEDQRRADGAEANITNSARVASTGANASEKVAAAGREYSAQLAQSKALSEDAKKLFSDLQLDNDRVPARPAVKRKAPKGEREVEKPDPVEKQRHYDSESVRQFMAKQKAERQRRREEARKAEEQEQQKRRKLMQELISKQKSAVATTTTATATAKPKKVKRVGKGKQRVLFPSGQNGSHDQRIRALLAGDSDKENSELLRQMEVDEDDNSDADTLTGESEEGSTPRATPVNTREDTSGRPEALDYNNENNIRPHSDHRLASSTAAAAAAHSPTTSQQPPGGTTIQFQGKKLHLDVNSVLSRFSQVLSQRQAQSGGGALGEGGVGLGAGMSSAERSRQERLYNLKASARNLQSKIASASAEISAKPESRADPDSCSSSEAEFVPRYDRIAGSRDNFSVFTSNLPGAQNVVTRSSASDERAPTAAARTSFPPQRDSVSTTLPRAPQLIVNSQDENDDDSSVTETSTFSEVTAADEWETETPKKKMSEVGQGSNMQPADTGVVSGVQYRAPTGGNLHWENPHSDPYSVLNVFSRHQRHGIRAANRTERSGNKHTDGHSQSDSTRLKDPRLTTSQQVVFGQTAEGHPMMTRTTYTRVEATLQDHSQGSQPSSLPTWNRASRSEERSERINQSSFPSRVRSNSEDTQSLESEEDEVTPKAASSRQTSKKSVMGLRRQTSDTGQETDVSQLSEDEPRVSLRNYDRPIVDTSQQETGESRWSPAALERQMAAELARLESLEDSIRQLSSAERTRAVALAQQETVSVAQVLKARQQEHSAELRSLQLQVQEERLASAQQLQQQLNSSKGVQAPASDMSSLLVPLHGTRPGASRQLLEQAENRRPDSKLTNNTPASRSRSHDDTEYSETFTSMRDGSKAVSSHSPSRSTTTRTPASRSRSSPSVRTAEDSAASIKTAEDLTESVKTAEDSQADSDSSIKTASDAERGSPDISAAPRKVPEDDYSLSFEESVTEDESLKEGRHSDSHRRDAKRRKNNKPPLSEDRSSYRVNDLTSVFGGEDSFNRFTIDIVRNIMREEEMRAQHQESLLRIRVKALKEKTKAQLSLLEQEKQQLLEKGKAKDAQPEAIQRELKRLADKEKAILKEQEEHKAEIDRMFKSEELAREHRQSLLKQHEQIAKMQEETREKMKQLQVRLGGPVEGQTEDETSLMEDLSDASDVSYAKDSKLDTEATQRKAKARGDQQKLEKQQKLRLDQKYLTVREQKLMERKKQASELLRWKRDLDAEEEKVLQLERTALQAWEGRVSDKPSATRGAGAADKKKERDAKREETEKKVKAPGNLRPEPGARSETTTTPRTARSETAVTPRSAVDSYTPFSQSEAVSTHISVSESDHKRSGTESSNSRSRAPRSRLSQTTESSVPEDIPDGSELSQRVPSPDKRLDSSDDTIINSSVNEEEETEGRSRSKGKKSPVGRLLPPGNSPLPQPWSRKTGSESESEESVSHTETLSDVSDYEVRIRQLSDMLRRRRKEADMLKKERSKRMKDKLRAQEESLKKQLEAYEIYIAQVKTEQADLEHEGGKPTVPPKIKQPQASKSRTSPSSSPSPNRRSQHDDPNYSSSYEGTDSNQTSPALSEGMDSKVPPLSEKGKKKPASSSIMDRISEGSESQSDRSRQDAKKGCSSDKSGLPRSISDDLSVSEAIEEAVDSASGASDPSAILNIKTSDPAKADTENKTASMVDENISYSQDFSETVSQSLAKSHSRIPVSIRSDASHASGRSAAKSEVSEVIESAVSTAKSDSSAAPKFDLKATPAGGKEGSVSAASASSSRPQTGIQESDSESESRINRTLSRPSSERSTGSTTYSDLHDFDEEEEDIISSESDRTPVKVSVSQKERSPVAQSVRTEEDISEHVSVSLPSISEKKSVSQAAALGQQDSIDAVLGDLLGEEDATPTQTPRAETPPLGQEDAPDPLLMTDPLADFHEGDRVLVGGHHLGTLHFKGPVTFAPGFWAGVELDAAEGDTDGQRDGKRYFTCEPDHGVLVPGSEISAAEDQGLLEEAVKPAAEGVKSPDESLTDQDESSATDGEKSESPKPTTTTMTNLKAGEEEKAEESEPLRKEVSSPSSRRNLDLLADDITADLAKSLMNDSMQTINSIASRRSPPSSPAQKSPPPTLPKPKMPAEQQAKMEREKEVKREAQNQRVESATSAVVGGLLDDAISKMIQIHRGRQEMADGKESRLVNGYSDNDSGVDPSHDSSLEPGFGYSPEPEVGGGELEELKRPMSPEPFLRPKSPVPVKSQPQEEQDDDYDFTGLMGDDQDFFDDDDFGLSGKPPPPYPGAGDQTRAKEAGGADSSTPAAKSTLSTDLFIIPHERAEVEAIVADAVAIYWNLRRCGESWESATPPPEYLSEHSSPGGAGEQMEGMVLGSRRTFRRLVFDLTGNIVRDIYQHEDDLEPPPWQKAPQKRQRFFKGHSPPSTMDGLMPVVQSTVTDILGLNGCSGRHRGKAANKWNVRKKKDHVDAVLVEELQEEEADWINYDNDELSVKMQLTDTIFESLLADTVATLNEVYSKRQQRLQTS